MRYGAELRSIALGVVVELEKRDSQKLHILRHAQYALLRQLQQVELLAFFGTSAMRWEVWVHEGLVVGSVPLGEGGVDVPVVVCGLLLERTGGREAVIQTDFEAFDLVGIVRDVVARSG